MNTPEEIEMSRELDIWNHETRTSQQHAHGGSSSSTRHHHDSSFYGKHPPLIVTFPRCTGSKTATTENNQAVLQADLSPLPFNPYENHDQEQRFHQQEEYSRDETRTKKRQRWTQSEYSSFLQYLDEQMDDITGKHSANMIKTETMNDSSTCRSTPGTLNNATCCTITTASTQSTKHFEEEHINREYLSATLNFPYKEFISNNDKDHVKIWNDEEEQMRLEKHFNPKWQVDFLSMFYGPEGSIRYESVITPTNSIDESSCTMQENSKKRFKYNDDTDRSTSTILVNDTNDSMENNTSDKKENDLRLSPNVSGPDQLQEAALKLCDAMDMTDLSRDSIARFERNTKFNRQDFLKMKFHLGLK